MKKKDLVISGIIGLLNGTIFFSVLKGLKISIPYSWTFPIFFPFLGALGIYLAWLLGKKFLIVFQGAKFFLVGTLNTFIDLGVLNLLIFVSGIARGIFYSLFKGISFLTATINSYFFNKYWTFEKKEKPTFKEFSKFLGTVGIGLLINVGVASFIVNFIGPQFGISEKIWANIGAFIAVFFAFLWNFLASKFFVFKK